MLPHIPLSDILLTVGENSSYLYMPQRCKIFLPDISHLLLNVYSHGIYFMLMSARSSMKRQIKTNKLILRAANGIWPWRLQNGCQVLKHLLHLLRYIIAEWNLVSGAPTIGKWPFKNVKTPSLKSPGYPAVTSLWACFYQHLKTVLNGSWALAKATWMSLGFG